MHRQGRVDHGLTPARAGSTLRDLLGYGYSAQAGHAGRGCGCRRDTSGVCLPVVWNFGLPSSQVADQREAVEVLGTVAAAIAVGLDGEALLVVCGGDERGVGGRLFFRQRVGKRLSVVPGER